MDGCSLRARRAVYLFSEKPGGCEFLSGPATFTLTLAHLLHPIQVTVSIFRYPLVMWRFLVADVKPCNSSITY
jgi:hypothetical protein